MKRASTLIGLLTRGPVAVGAVAVAAFPLPARAAEGEAAGGMPQFNPALYSEQLIWLAITFAVLYLIMSRLAVPRLNQVFNARATRIDSDLDQAAKLKKEAEAALEEFEKAMADARSQAQAILSEARDKVTEATRAREAEVDEKIKADLAAAELRIGNARDVAMAEIEGVAAEAAAAIAVKLTGIAVPEAEAQAAAKAALGR